jgi:mlo protein
MIKNGLLVRLIFSLKQILLLVGAKLEHIITRLGQESVAKEDPTKRVKPSDEYFWFGRPAIVLDLLHFTLFQNSFEIAFFFWIWVSIFTLNFAFKSNKI